MNTNIIKTTDSCMSIAHKDSVVDTNKRENFTEIMVDLETLSTASNSIILSIGAVKFDRSFELPKIENCEVFYRRINIDSCRKVGLVSSEDTINWWNKQDESVRYEALDNPDRSDLKDVLNDFSKWLGYNTFNKKIWGHGDDFDCVILDNAYKCCGLKTPWNFWNTRDTRTLFDIANININDFPITGAHHALNDAYRQVKCVKIAFSKLYKK